MVQVIAKDDTPIEVMQRREEASARHERLVAYVHALSDTQEVRTGVWMEHSYARARGSPPADSTPRVLLAPRALPATEEPLDVERLDPPPPSPPPPRSPFPSDSSASESDGAEEEWEARAVTLAPTATHARLVGRALEVLRAQRLALLAAKGCSTSRSEAARAAARRLRSALAAQGAGPARWLHATLSAQVPRRLRRQYDEAIAELARAAPSLAERLGVAPVSRPASPLRECEAEGPRLAWVEEGRWARRLAALVPTRVLRPPESAAGPPEAWCAALAGALRAELAEVLAEAGARGVVVGGAGAGAALAAWLCAGGGAGVRGAVLVAPALETAEGARDSPEDALREVRVPVLAVCGGGWRARAACARGGRRVLEVRGTDAALRVSRGRRRRGRVTQEALDAAVAEECARWVQEMADGDPEESRSRRIASLDGHHKIVHSSNAEIVVGLGGARDREEEESSQLAGGTSVHTARSSLEVTEGRVVARVSGGTPLALAPPRRSACSPPRRSACSPPRGSASGSASGAAEGARLAPTDIMQMPIVFADDAGARARGAARARAGAPHESVSYSRIIVAKRSAGAGAGARGAMLVRRAARRDR